MKILCLILITSLIYPMEKDIESGESPENLTIIIPRHQRRRSSLVFVEEDCADHICTLAFQSFSITDSPQASRVRNFLCQHIRTALESPNVHERENLRAIESFHGQSLDDDYLKRYLQELLLRATTDALATAESEAQESREEAEARVSKTKAAYYAIASSTVTAILGIAATLAMHYTD